MTVSRTTVGLFVGLILGVVAAFGTIGDFFLVLVLGAVGLLIGAALDGKIDFAALLGRERSRR